jgi:membrane-associated phospholipid phosphatase
MPLTVIDGWIPFQPAAVIAYFSLWVYVGIAPGLQGTFKELFSYGLWVGALCLAGLGIFYLWPTRIPVVPVEPTDFPGFAILRGVDAAGNACPSMHVAVAIFTALWVDHVFRVVRTPVWTRLVNAAWFIAIAYSTLAVRQHVALDALAGAALGATFAIPSLVWRPGRRPDSAAAAAIMETRRARADGGLPRGKGGAGGHTITTAVDTISRPLEHDD